MNPSSRKRIRSDLSDSEDEKSDYDDSDNEHEINISKKPEVNYPRFIVLKPTYSHQPLTKLSPFAVAKSIQGRFGTVNQVKKMKDGGLLIEASRNIQARHLLDTQTFLDIEVDAEPHRSLNTSEGTIRDFHQDLRYMTDDQIKQEAKEKHRGAPETQKPGDKTSPGETGPDTRTHASPKAGQDQAPGGASAPRRHAAPAPRKPCTTRQKAKPGNKIQTSNGQKPAQCPTNGGRHRTRPPPRTPRNTRERGTPHRPARPPHRPQNPPRDDPKRSPTHPRPRSPPESRTAPRTKHPQEEQAPAHRTSRETKTPQAGEDGTPPPRNGKPAIWKPKPPRLPQR